MLFSRFSRGEGGGGRSRIGCCWVINAFLIPPESVLSTFFFLFSFFLGLATVMG